MECVRCCVFAECPRCDTPTADGVCSHHPGAPVLWRAKPCDYADYAEVVAHGLPLYVPWPVGDWTLVDLGYAIDDGRAVAAYLTATRLSDVDGDVEVSIVSEEPLVGLGARIAGLPHADPGPSLGVGPALLHLDLDGHRVPLWSVGAADLSEPLLTEVLVGEWQGRWLWIVVHPATALLSLGAEFELADAAQFGPEALDLPFGGSGRDW